MLNKLGYIKLGFYEYMVYIEVLWRAHAIEINVNYLSYIEVRNQVIEISWIFSVSWSTLQNQLTLLSFLTNICHSYIEHFEHIESK